MHLKWEKIVWPLRVHMSCLFNLHKLLIWNYSRCFNMFIKFIPGIYDICKYIAAKWKMLRSRKKERCPLSLWPCLVSVWNRVPTGLLSLKAQSWLHWVVAEKGEGCTKCSWGHICLKTRTFSFQTLFMLNILTDLVFGELREYLEDGTESFLWRILMGGKKKPQCWK